MILYPALFLNFLSINFVISENNCASEDYIHCGDNDPYNCISKDWWCDGHPDCESGKDEANCPIMSCLSTEFVCHSGTQCIPKLLQCDGVFHCFDKSDEKNCTTTVPKTCDPLTEFDCNNDGINCIPLSKACNGVNDCGRNQDELPGNSVANCQRNNCQLILNGGCSHFCANFFTYIKCYCPEGYQLLPDNKTCVDIDECAALSPKCSQICKNTLGGYNCHCHHGYIQTSANPGICVAGDGDRSLLITLNGGRLLTINLNTGSNYSSVLRGHREIWSKVDVDLHPNPQTIFWNTQKNGIIGRVKTKLDSNKSDRIRFFFENLFTINHNESFCTGLSFDWLRGLLFWTSARENRIYVTNTISNATSLLLDKGLRNPRNIAVNPWTTMIYWIEWATEHSRAKIHMMLMNTQNRQTIVNSGLQQPLDLAIDFLENKLYWSDINPGSISYIDLNNPTIPKVIISNKLLHPFSIAIFENKIYWSDWRQNQIISTDKIIGNDFTIVAKVSKPFAIRVLHTLSQPLVIPSEAKFHSCLKNEANPCSHICVPFPPTRSEKGNGTRFQCKCPVELLLAKDQMSCHSILSIQKQLTNYKRQQIILGVALSLIMILCLSLSIICVYICRQRSWAQSNKSNNRKLFNHPIVTGDLMFIFKCNSHSSQLSELLTNELSNASTA